MEVHTVTSQADIFAWIGSILLAVCAVPQAVESAKKWNASGLSWAFLGLWLAGEIFVTIWTLINEQFILLLNYGLNLAIVCLLIAIKSTPGGNNHGTNSKPAQQSPRRGVAGFGRHH
jgi:hypothetical protein